MNMIEELKEGAFVGLGNLNSLNLLGNPLRIIEPNAFYGLQNLPVLSLKGLYLHTLQGGSFNHLEYVTSLDLSNNKINTMDPGVFDGLKSLQHLNISKNEIDHFLKEDFVGLMSLLTLDSDEYMFCCFVDIGIENCSPKPDQFSSCDDLMTNNVLRIFLWILGVMAFAGNIFVLVWRTLYMEGGAKVPNLLLCNLSIADFFMGLYMLSIASIDLYYRGNYIENAKWWKNSGLCGFLGCLSTVSSEASVLSLSVITFDRLFNIVFPLSLRKLDIKKARIVVACVWLVALLMGVVPLFPSDYFKVSIKDWMLIGNFLLCFCKCTLNLEGFTLL